MPRRSPAPDLVKPVTIGGIFFVLGVVIAGFFLLENTRMLLVPSVPNDPNIVVSTDLVNLEATVVVDARQGWQTTNILVERGADIKITVVDGQ